MTGFNITREQLEKYLKQKDAPTQQKTTPPKEQKTPGQFKITREDIDRYLGKTSTFTPDFKFTPYDTPLDPDSGVEVIDDDMTIEEELKAIGYSGYYKEMHDGPISRIIPVDKYGNREDIM